MTAKPNKSLHRMLSPTGNPSMDNLAAIFRAVRGGYRSACRRRTRSQSEAGCKADICLLCHLQTRALRRYRDLVRLVKSNKLDTSGAKWTITK
jgi:hypothetical protein